LPISWIEDTFKILITDERRYLQEGAGLVFSSISSPEYYNLFYPLVLLSLEELKYLLSVEEVKDDNLANSFIRHQ